jgi:PEP-CTERM motif
MPVIAIFTAREGRFHGTSFCTQQRGVSPMAKTIVVFLSLIGWAGIAAADSITIVNDQRAVNVLAQVNDSSQTNSQGPGDALSATTVVSAGTSFADSTTHLTSSLADPAHLSGSGSALAFFSTLSTGGAASAAAVFAVDFVVDAPQIYSFNGAFNISDFPVRPSNGTFNEGRWVASLSSGDSFLFNLGDTHEALASDGGNLPVGTYHFLVETTGAGSSERPATVDEDTQFQFAFDLTPAPVDSNPSPTPEPASVLLVGAGVAGFVAAGKTKRAQNAVHRIG